MTDDNERLLQQFFSEPASRQIADDGFTERVMRRLPARTDRFVLIWNMVCVAAFATLFVAFRGWEMLAVQLESLLRAVTDQPLSVTLANMLAAVFGLLFVAVIEVATAQRRLL